MMIIRFVCVLMVATNDWAQKGASQHSPPDSSFSTHDDITRRKKKSSFSISMQNTVSVLRNSSTPINRWPAVRTMLGKGSCRRQWEYPWLSRWKCNAFHGIRTPTAVTTTDAIGEIENPIVLKYVFPFGSDLCCQQGRKIDGAPQQR
jgi:hypothetical protein